MTPNLSGFTPEVIVTIIGIGMVIGLIAVMFYKLSKAGKKPARPNNVATLAKRVANDPRTKTVAVVAMIAMMIAVPTLRIHAQSIMVDFDSSDLDIFFDYFNMMFNALLGIALLGAGITAGGAFVWVIGNMLTNAFTRMLRGSP